MVEAYNRRGIDEPMVRCLPPGTPRTTLMGLFPMQIVQTPKLSSCCSKSFTFSASIPIDAKHPDDLEPSFMGDSVGHWEGDTLVVDVTGFNNKTWLSGTGTIHSEKLHVVEKFTRVDENTIVYEDTVEDSVVLARTLDPPRHAHAPPGNAHPRIRGMRRKQPGCAALRRTAEKPFHLYAKAIAVRTADVLPALRS